MTNVQREMPSEKRRLGFLAVQNSDLQICSVALFSLMLLYYLILPFAAADGWGLLFSTWGL